MNNLFWNHKYKIFIPIQNEKLYIYYIFLSFIQKQNYHMWTPNHENLN